MRIWSVFFIILVFLISCKKGQDIKMGTNWCDQTINYDSASYKGLLLNVAFKHSGYCYEMIDSMIGHYYHYDDNGNVIDSIIFKIPRDKVNITKPGTTNTAMNFTFSDKADNSKLNKLIFSAHYQGGGTSNIIQTNIDPYCPSELSNGQSVLLAKDGCEIDGETGDRFYIVFKHKGYCAEDISKIDGYGDFYEYSDYLSTSTFTVDNPDLSVVRTDTLYNNLGYSLCVKWGSYSDHIDVYFRTIYKNNRYSNYTNVTIYKP